MGIASMVIGIISVIIEFIPFCGYFALIPAIVGFVLGIVSLMKSKKLQQPTGMAVAGIVCNAVAILVIGLYTLIFAAPIAAATVAEGVSAAANSERVTEQ